MVLIVPEDSIDEKKALLGEKEILHNINIGDMVLNTLKSKPDFIGQINAETGEKITFQQMRENSVKCALWLKKLNIYYKNIVIGICTNHQSLAYIPYLAGLYVQAIINPWNKKYFEDKIRLMAILVEYGPEIIFIDSENYETLISVVKEINAKEEIITPPIVVTFDRIVGINSLELILSGDFNNDEIDKLSCDEINPLNIMATAFFSNAINYPGKLHMSYYAFAFPSNLEIPAMSSGDVGLWYGSLEWTYSLLLTVRSIISYVTVVKCSTFTDEIMFETIEKYKVSWVFLDSSMCNQLFHTDICMYNVSSLKQFVFGDSNIYPDIYEKLFDCFINATFTQVYGAPETAIIASYQYNNRIEVSGHVAKNIELAIQDINTRETAGPNKAGEICFRFTYNFCNIETCNSPSCHNYQARKNKIKKPVPLSSKWYGSGDYGYYEKDREVFIIDKVRNVIKYRLYQIPSVKIENMLQRHPAVSEVVVRSVPNLYDGQHPIAYVKKEEGVKVTKEELMKFVADRMPDIFKLRGGVHFKKEMPYLPNGKIDRQLVHRW